MKATFFRTALLGLSLLGLASCESLFMPEDRGASPQEIFDEAWTFADREYAFFEFKGIDWNAVRQRYQLRVSDDLTEEELFSVLADMLNELRDGHVNLFSDFNISRNDTWYLNSPENFDFSVLERGYFRQRQQFVGPFILYDFGDVGYIRYSSFSSAISAANLNYALSLFAERKGIIIDIRNNPGGSLLNAIRMAARFTDKRVLAGRERVKNGPGHNDFSSLRDVYIEPANKSLFDTEDPVLFTKPVVVLTNRSSYSAANYFPMYMKALPNVTLVGDTTGGGGGAPANTELANGWGIRVSASQLFDDTGFNVEDGIPPDVRVDLDRVQALNFVDTMLEAALELLRQ